MWRCCSFFLKLIVLLFNYKCIGDVCFCLGKVRYEGVLERGLMFFKISFWDFVVECVGFLFLKF